MVTPRQACGDVRGVMHVWHVETESGSGVVKGGWKVSKVSRWKGSAGAECKVSSSGVAKALFNVMMVGLRVMNASLSLWVWLG